MKKKLTIALIILLISFISYKIYSNIFLKNENNLTFYGNIDTRTVNVGFRFLGKIENITKDEGEIVKKDEVLVKLDTASLEKSLEELNEKIFASKLELSKLQTGYRQEEILEAKAAMEEAIENLNKTKDTYNRQTNLFKTKSTSEENFTISQLNYKQALATLDKAKALYELRKNGYRDEDIKIQESNLKSLEIQAEKLKIDLNDSVIKAPVDGVILTRFKEIGAITNAGESILEIAKTDEFWVRAYIDEKNLGNIKPGLKMSIQTDSRSENYEGVIGFISPVAEFTPKNIETQELRADLVYSFRVRTYCVHSHRIRLTYFNCSSIYYSSLITNLLVCW